MITRRLSARTLAGVVTACVLVLSGCAAAPRHTLATEMPPPYIGHKEVPETLYTRQLKHRLAEPGSPPVLSEEEEKRLRNQDIKRTVEELY